MCCGDKPQIIAGAVSLHNNLRPHICGINLLHNSHSSFLIFSLWKSTRAALQQTWILSFTLTPIYNKNKFVSDRERE